MLDTALGSPYLMHAILALSALHKSFTCALPQRIQYSDLAESLQQQGLSAFTKLGGEIDPAQAVPAFLFSWTTGLHRLCTTLADPVLHDPQAFLSAVADCIEVLRGVTTLLGQGIENLKHSALSMLTDFSSLDSARLRRESPNVAQQRIDKCTELLAEGHENDPSSQRCGQITTKRLCETSISGNKASRWARDAEMDDGEPLGLCIAS